MPCKKNCRRSKAQKDVSEKSVKTDETEWKMPVQASDVNEALHWQERYEKILCWLVTKTLLVPLYPPGNDNGAETSQETSGLSKQIEQRKSKVPADNNNGSNFLPPSNLPNRKVNRPNPEESQENMALSTAEPVNHGTLPSLEEDNNIVAGLENNTKELNGNELQDGGNKTAGVEKNKVNHDEGSSSELVKGLIESYCPSKKQIVIFVDMDNWTGIFDVLEKFDIETQVNIERIVLFHAQHRTQDLQGIKKKLRYKQLDDRGHITWIKSSDYKDSADSRIGQTVGKLLGHTSSKGFLIKVVSGDHIFFDTMDDNLPHTENGELDLLDPHLKNDEIIHNFLRKVEPDDHSQVLVFSNFPKHAGWSVEQWVNSFITNSLKLPTVLAESAVHVPDIKRSGNVPKENKVVAKFSSVEDRKKVLQASSNISVKPIKYWDERFGARILSGADSLGQVSQDGGRGRRGGGRVGKVVGRVSGADSKGQGSRGGGRRRRGGGRGRGSGSGCDKSTR